MPQITPNLWFDTNGEQAAEFYVSIFPNSKITNVTHYSEAGPREAGSVMTVDFVLDGQPYTAINGGPEFTFSEAVSLLVNCDDQDEVDHYWDKLREGGGEEVQCGWLKDKFGFSWQVFPTAAEEVLGDPDPARAERAMKAMLGMKKIDLAALRAAADGESDRHMPVVAEAPKSSVERGTARARLLDAAVQVIRTKGLNATTVDDLCVAAGVTKGAFFHHFDTKEALAVAAAEHWSATTGALFAAAPYHDRPTAARRIFGYLDFRTDLISGSPQDYTCLVGTMVQEVFVTNPEVRHACADSIFGHAGTLEADLAEALVDAGAPPGIDAAGLARFTQSVLQGAFVLGKAGDDPTIVTESIAHLRRYLTLLFDGGGHT